MGCCVCDMCGFLGGQNYLDLELPHTYILIHTHIHTHIMKIKISYHIIVYKVVSWKNPDKFSRVVVVTAN